MWPQRQQSVLDEVIPKCPLDFYVPKFPCPGPHKHQLNYFDEPIGSPCGKGEVLCRLGAFCNLRYTTSPGSTESHINGSVDLLDKTLIGVASCDTDVIVQLGGVLDSTNLQTRNELQNVFTNLQKIFEKSYSKIFHVMGDTEAAVRSGYVNSFFGDVARKLDDTSCCVRCCGNAFYSVPIGPEYTLVVIDGYELIVVDPQKFDEPPCIMNSEATGEGLQIRTSLREASGHQCAMHGEEDRIGWAQEMRCVGNFLTHDDTTVMPRLRCAVSRSQLRWLDFTLQKCLHNNQNVVLACHAPLHPLLVRDRSSLVLNWSEVLKISMRYNVVKLILTGRPIGQGSEPIPDTLPYTRDHGILYFSLPPVCQTTGLKKSASVFLIADLGYDYVRVRGEGLGLSQADREFGCIAPFRPKRKLDINERDYSFNGAF